MIEAQLVTGATQDMRIFTRSAPRRRRRARRQRCSRASISIGACVSSWVVAFAAFGRFDATLQSGGGLGKGRNWRTLGEGAALDLVAPSPLWRGLLQHAPLGFNRVKAGDRGCDSRDGRDRGEDR